MDFLQLSAIAERSWAGWEAYKLPWVAPETSTWIQVQKSEVLMLPEGHFDVVLGSAKEGAETGKYIIQLSP